MCSDGWMNLDKAETMAPLPCCLVRAMSVLVRDNGQTTQRTGKYLGFCPTKKAGCSYTYSYILLYISINYRLRSFYKYLNRHMEEDQKEFD